MLAVLHQDTDTVEVTRITLKMAVYSQDLVKIHGAGGAALLKLPCMAVCLDAPEEPLNTHTYKNDTERFYCSLSTHSSII